MSYLGNPGNFDYKINDWAIYKCRLEQFFVANEIDSEVKKRAILLNSFSEESIRLIQDLAQPGKAAEAEFSDIQRLLDAHFIPSGVA